MTLELQGFWDCDTFHVDFRNQFLFGLPFWENGNQHLNFEVLKGTILRKYFDVILAMNLDNDIIQAYFISRATYQSLGGVFAELNKHRAKWAFSTHFCHNCQYQLKLKISIQKLYMVKIRIAGFRFAPTFKTIRQEIP